ncbi:hypothetical protein RRG08_001546 [Elysia crispata]|uniref:15-hydroxyprostaglandin dehydrogenase [NAD(+)] n=1 Tax=Elysia crispata TaxID=231223 RepID=A0AAE1AK76_9GAST|nr:hypothetical protein RRG08_001546 [Elysia crispata]
MPEFNVRDKVFFITGGASGIGRGLAEGVLARQGKVFFIDVQEEAGQEAQNELAATYGAINVRFGKADVTNREGFQETFNLAVTIFGKVDVMVNNAGIVRETRPAQVIAVNLLGAIYGTEIAMAHMRKDHGGRGGRVVNISSLYGLIESPFLPVYGATKQGIRSYTQSLSLSPKLEEIGVEYATLHPDGVQTSLVLNVQPGDILYLEELTKQFEEKYLQMEKLVDAFFQLVSLEKMNGAALLVKHGTKTFVELSLEEKGDTFTVKPRL